MSGVYVPINVLIAIVISMLTSLASVSDHQSREEVTVRVNKVKLLRKHSAAAYRQMLW